MKHFIVEIPVGFNFSTTVKAEDRQQAIEKAIELAESEYNIRTLDCEYDRINAWIKELI